MLHQGLSLCEHIWSLQQTFEVDTVITLILQMRELKHRIHIEM